MIRRLEYDMVKEQEQKTFLRQNLISLSPSLRFTEIG
jgi:hypothetical protein